MKKKKKKKNRRRRRRAMGMGEEEEEKKAIGFFSYEDGWVFGNGEEEEMGVSANGTVWQHD